jgi:6-phosphogluconolactonase (cycloisomerase 2 family)
MKVNRLQVLRFESDVRQSRRRVLQGAASLGALGIANLIIPSGFASPEKESRDSVLKGKSMFAFVGSRTSRERNARGEGISVFRVNPQNGSLELVQLIKDLVNPSFLALSSNGKRLYTVHGDMREVTAFAVDMTTGALRFINTRSTGGENPVHLAIDPTGRYLIVSNHLSSSLAVLPIGADGSLEDHVQLVSLEGPIGPHRVEQNLSKPHYNPFDPSGEFVIVPDKGLDRIFTFRFRDGRLSSADPAFVTARSCSGPRHIAFHPSAGFAYCVNELDSTVTVYGYTAGSGALTPLQIVSTLPDTFTGESRASEIEIDRSGRFGYASNRGAASIAVFSIDAKTGHVQFLEAVPTLGRTPRFITTDPTDQFMYALNEDSDSIVAFAVDHVSGRLKQTGSSVQCGSPVCMVFSQRPA